MNTFISENEIQQQSLGFSSLSGNLPKTIVLLITTHGLIKMNKRAPDIPITFIIPEDFTLIRSLTTNFGECNFINEEMTKGYVSEIKYNLLMSDDFENNTEDDLLNKIKNTTNRIKNIDSKVVPMIENKLKTANEEDIEDINDYRGYVYGSDRSHSVQVFHSGDSVTDKYYSRMNAEYKLYDWTIKVLNIPGEPDLLEYLFKAKRGPMSKSEIRLSDIVNFFKSKSVTNLIIFDTSCSVLTNYRGRYFKSPRTVRNIRRNVIDTKQIKNKNANKSSGITLKYGGKRKTRKHKRRLRLRRK